jgi:hypothetical protein
MTLSGYMHGTRPPQEVRIIRIRPPGVVCTSLGRYRTFSRRMFDPTSMAPIGSVACRTSRSN